MGRIKVIIFACVVLAASPCWATNWYVDNAASGANNGTSWTDAWQAFASITWGGGGVVAGDTLYISGGSTTKTYTTELAVGASGSSGNPITISVGQDAGHNGTAIIDRSNAGQGINISSRSYITITGEYSGERRLKIYQTSLSSGYSAAILATSANQILYSYIEIEQAATGIYQNGQLATSQSEISNCYIWDIRGECPISFLYASGQVPSSHGNFSVHDSIIRPVWETYAGGVKGPDGIQGSGSIDFYNNTVWGIDGGDNTGIIVGTQHPDMIQAQNSYWRIYNNNFLNIGDSAIDFDMFNADASDTLSNVIIYNNLFNLDTSHPWYPWGFRAYRSGGSISTVDGLVIANNTFIDLHYINVIDISAVNSATVTNSLIKNNIFYNVGTIGGSNYGVVRITASSNASQADWNFDYNLINAGANGVTLVTVDGASYTQANPITSAPTFTSYTEFNANNDLTLQSGSAGIDQGISLSSYFTTDKSGNPRDANWDIGAYENQSVWPTISTIAVATNGTTVTITASEALTQGVGYNDTDLDIDCPSNANIGLTYVSGDGTTTLVYTAAQTILASDGSSCNFDFNGDADSLEDGDGNDLAAIVSQSVDNNSSQGATANTGRVMQYNAAGKAAVYNASGYQLVAP